MQSDHLTVVNEVGLHARPAALFVNTASSFQASVQVRNATTSSDWVDGKSILGVLVLGVEKGHEIDLQIEGPDELEATRALGDLIRSDFAEGPRNPVAGGAGRPGTGVEERAKRGTVGEESGHAGQPS
jgi:phosphotransferase system HPr (HPr) family protein